MVSSIEAILQKCGGVRVETKQAEVSMWDSHPRITYTFFKTGDIELPDAGIFIKIIASATKGTIAKVVDLEVETWAERYPDSPNDNPNKIIMWDTTLIYEVEGRKQKGRIKESHTKVLEGEHETKYVRDVQTHEKVVIENPVNKYKQEMKKGDWVIGTRPGKRLGIGRITRWTNHNVWAVAGEDLNGREFRFDSIKETFTMPDDEHVKLLTMAVLKGWHGE